MESTNPFNSLDFNINIKEEEERTETFSSFYQESDDNYPSFFKTDNSCNIDYHLNQVFHSNNPSQSTSFESGVVNQIENNMEKEFKSEENCYHFKEEEEEVKSSPVPEIKTETISVESDYNMFDHCNEEFEREKSKAEESSKSEPSHRKLAADSIRKKIKIRVEETIRKTVNKYYVIRLGKNAKIQFKKMPQNFLKDVSIGTNKMCLEMDLETRYKYDFGDKSKKKLKHNVDTIHMLKHKYNEDENPKSILRRKTKDIIKDYFESKAYEDDLVNIEEEEGLEYREKYEEYAKGNGDILGFVDYFLKMPANKSKNGKSNKNN